MAIRLVVLVAGLGIGALAAGLAFNQSWAADTWPWADAELSHLFVASIWSAIAAIGVGIAAVGDLGELQTGAVALAVMFGGSTVCLFVRAGEGHGLRYALFYGAVCLFALVFVALGSSQLPIRDKRPMPKAVRAFFGFAVLVLTAAGLLLLCRVQAFPWLVDERSEAMFGCISLGAATYFFLSMVKSRWQDARGGAIALIAYDVVLLPSYVQLPAGNGLYSTALPVNDAHLAVYIAFLAVTLLFAVYYLFINRSTRSWRIVDCDDERNGRPSVLLAAGSSPRP
jgi:hypothetical protein